MRLSSEISLYVPIDVTQTPQYKFGGRFYSATTLEPEIQLRSNLAIIINTEILISKPLLVLYQFNRWGLYVTSENELYNIGFSETYYRSSDRPLAVHELTVPRLNPFGLGIMPSPKPNFDQNQKDLIINSTSPVEGIIVGGERRAVEMNRNEVERPRPYAIPVGTYERDRESPPQSPRREPLIQSSSSDQLPDQLPQQSYETLVKQLYGLPVVLPEFLIVNDLKLRFIPFSQLSTIQIERYIIEPLLQPWAGPTNTQNRILTIFGTNGMTYLVKAKYDQATNQIFPPL